MHHTHLARLLRVGTLLVCASLLIAGMTGIPGGGAAAQSSAAQTSYVIGAEPAQAPPPPTPIVDEESGRSTQYQSIPLVQGEPVHPAYETPPLHDQPQAYDASGRLESSIQAGPAGPNIPAASTFEGLSRAGISGDIPPDVAGDVGPNDYVQAVNTAIGVFNKSTGALRGSWTFDVLMDPQGNSTKSGCQTGQHHGDPSVVYDPVNDRWIVADVGWVDAVSGPYYECIALSATGDPTGSWQVSNLQIDPTNPTYRGASPRIGLWSGVLLMAADLVSCDDLSCTTETAHGARVWVMGLTTLIDTGTLYWSAVNDSGHTSLLPSNLHGQSPPPSNVEGYGSPGYFAALAGSGVDVWTVTYLYPYPVAGSLTGPTAVTVDTGSAAPATIPQQPGTDVGDLDSVGGRLMPPIQYRNIGGTESLWMSHTVGNGGTPNIAGIRWYQLDVTSGTIATTAVQAGTHQPDTTYRWLPSLAVDHVGDMALGFSASSSSIHPGIRYAGRVTADPAGELARGEATMFGGSGSQTTTSAWGQNSSMSVDPVDDCTFWYSNEYYGSDGTDWSTRIGSFRVTSPKGEPGDLDADRKADPMVFEKATGNWFAVGSQAGFLMPALNFGNDTNYVPVPGDYDLDGRTDAAVFEKSTGNWFAVGSNCGFSTPALNFGNDTSYIPVPGDYDGDGRTDAAVFEKSTGNWFAVGSTSGFFTPALNFGNITGYDLVQGDYDGDGKMDAAVFEKATGNWYVVGSTSGFFIPALALGDGTDYVPVPGDYDGDGKTDPAVFEKATGNWFVDGSTDGFFAPALNFGNATDYIPKPADYDGDGKTDPAVYETATGNWFVVGSTDGFFSPALGFGSTSYIPLVEQPR